MNGRVQGIVWLVVMLALLASGSGWPERLAMVVCWTAIGAFRWWLATTKKAKGLKG